MYSVSEEYANKIIADDRSFAVRLTFVGSSTQLTGTTIQNITLEEIVNSTDALTMGCACSNKVVVNLINPPLDIAYDGAAFTVEIGLLLSARPVTYEWVPLGTFYGAKPETNNDFKNLKLTGYDGFCKMTGKYNATVPSSTTLQAVYNDLRLQLHENCGVTLKTRTLPNYPITNFPYLDVTYAQTIGFVAGCLGEVARFNRDGELEMVWYTDSGILIDRKMQYMDGLKRTTEKEVTITSVSTGTTERAIVRGDGANGHSITFENPYMTDTMADAIYNAVYHFSYTPCQVKWRGNPAIQAGDMVQVTDKNNLAHTVLVMQQSIVISGGLHATIDCKGNGETQSEFSNGYETVGQKIQRMYTTLEQSILDATNAITGNQGGYVELLDTNNDGKPDEIIIMNLENRALATKVWRWNKEGLGYSYNAAGNAYNGPYRTAITADGQIVANFITAGTLSAERIAVENFDANNPTKITDYIRFGNGTMTFGRGDSTLTLKLENDQVAFYNGATRIAYFSNNSFEIENLTDGKIRFQNFGFIPRSSGNLTFTKLL